jgi:hypothetical protein
MGHVKEGDQRLILLEQALHRGDGERPGVGEAGITRKIRA